MTFTEYFSAMNLDSIIMDFLKSNESNFIAHDFSPIMTLKDHLKSRGIDYCGVRSFGKDKIRVVAKNNGDNYLVNFIYKITSDGIATNENMYVEKTEMVKNATTA